MRNLALLWVWGLGEAYLWSSSKPEVPHGGMACDDGRTAIVAEWVNDDYCDCADGADEPRTSACSGATIGATAFVCANAGHVSLPMLSSRVGDSVCDCCDGSDERAGVCPNSCEASAVSARVAFERLAATRRLGLGRRARLVADAAARLGSNAAELAQAKSGMFALKQRIEALESEGVESALAEKVARDAAVAFADGEYETASAALLVGASAVDMVSGAVQLAIACGEVEALLDAVMRSRDLEQVSDAVDDVDALSRGLEASEAWRQVVDCAEESEASASAASSSSSEAATETRAPLLLPEQRASGARSRAIDGLAALRSALPLERIGADCAKIVLLEVAQTCRNAEKPNVQRALQIAAASLGLADDAAREIATRLAAPKANATLAAYETERAATVRAELAEKRTEKYNKDDAIKKLEPLSTLDLGPENAFLHLKDHCLSKKINQYTYEICPWGAAKQDTVTIGKFDKWEEGHTKWKFKNGQYCSGIGSRELLVDLVCGADDEILDVAETDICKYTATVQTPAAC